MQISSSKISTVDETKMVRFVLLGVEYRRNLLIVGNSVVDSFAGMIVFLVASAVSHYQSMITSPKEPTATTLRQKI